MAVKKTSKKPSKKGGSKGRRLKTFPDPVTKRKSGGKKKKESKKRAFSLMVKQ